MQLNDHLKLGVVACPVFLLVKKSINILGSGLVTVDSFPGSTGNDIREVRLGMSIGVEVTSPVLQFVMY